MKYKIIYKDYDFYRSPFSISWEQCKVNQIADIIGGGTPSTQTSEFWDGDIDWYAPAEMEGKIYANGSERKITKLGLQKSSAKLLPAYKTILFTSRAGIGKMAILQRVGATNQGFQSLVLKDEYNPYFIYSMGSKIKTKAETIASGSTFLEISGSMLGNIEISCPKENEQKKIGNYFNKLDNLITLHQRKQKWRLNQKLYKNYIKKLTISWEQCKVKELFKITRGYVLATTNTQEEFSKYAPYPVYSSQTKDNGLLGYYKDYLYEDAITWTTDGANAGTVNFRPGKFYCTNVCGVLLSDKLNTCRMVAEALNNVAKNYVSYVGNPKLMNNVMAEIPLMLVFNNEEREKISSIFYKLDNLITLHQCKDFCYFNQYVCENRMLKTHVRTITWEQCKLNEMVDYISSNLTASDASKDGNYELYDANNIIGRTNHEPIKTGYLTIIKDGAGVGRIRKMPKNTMFIGTMGALKPINNSLDFVFSLLTRFSLSNEFSGSTIPHIYFKDYGNNIYSVPKLKEQNKIGDLYCKLDNLITLHLRL